MSQSQDIGTLAVAVIKSLKRAGTVSDEARAEAVHKLFEVALAPVSGSPHRTFQLLAGFYMRNPALAEDLAQAALPLYGSRYLPPLFACLCYEWMFEGQGAAVKARLGVFFDGIAWLFAQDVDAGTRRFEVIFKYLREDVLVGSSGSHLPIVVLRAILAVVFRHMPFYDFHPQDNSSAVRPVNTENVKHIATALSAFVSQISARLTEKVVVEPTVADAAVPKTLYEGRVGLSKLVSPLAPIVLSPRSPRVSPRSEEPLIHSEASSLAVGATPTSDMNDDDGSFAGPLSPASAISTTPELPEPSLNAIKEPIFAAAEVAPEASVSPVPAVEAELASVSEASVLGVTDMLGAELVAQLTAIQSAQALVTYLRFAAALHAVPLTQRTSASVEATLYAFSTPGGPHYPSRTVREAARGALDVLRPTGRTTRFFVRSAFRLARPFHAAASIGHTAKVVAGRVTRAVFSCFRKMIPFGGRKAKAT